ncbi:MAG: PEP-CTERM sorting domain-containing protein [Planctomycetota bacterium]
MLYSQSFLFVGLIPEPATFFLLGLGAAMLRKRKR